MIEINCLECESINTHIREGHDENMQQLVCNDCGAVFEGNRKILMLTVPASFLCDRKVLIQVEGNPKTLTQAVDGLYEDIGDLTDGSLTQKEVEDIDLSWKLVYMTINELSELSEFDGC